MAVGACAVCELLYGSPLGVTGFVVSGMDADLERAAKAGRKRQKSSVPPVLARPRHVEVVGGHEVAHELPSPQRTEPERRPARRPPQIHVLNITNSAQPEARQNIPECGAERGQLVHVPMRVDV